MRANSLTEEVTSPVADSNGSLGGNGFLSSPSAHDGDTLRSAIDQAINSDAFQGAIASHLAKLIKPSIKSALDTIQPLVEAVYTHELLLRKTNQNVENALERMETNASKRNSRADFDEGEVAAALAEPAPVPIVSAPRGIAGSESRPDLDQFKGLLEASHAQHNAALAGLSSSVGASNNKIAEVAGGVVEIKTSLQSSVEDLKAASNESKTTIAVLQAQLDQLKTDVTHILEAIGSDLGKNVQAIHERGIAEPNTSFLAEHTTKLDTISTDLVALKGHGDAAEKIVTISTELAALKGSVEGGIASNSEGFTSLGAQITSVLSAIEGHTTLLGEIKESPAHPDLLAAIQQSNDSHAGHATALGELRERSLASRIDPAGEEGVVSPDTTAALNDLKSDLASLKENVKSGLTSHGENVTGLGTKIDTVLSVIEGNKASNQSADILAAVQQSNESHASHAAALEGIKSLGGESRDLGPQISSMISTLEAHTAALDEIKAANINHTTALEGHGTALEGLRSINEDAPPAPSGDSASLEPHITSIISTLEGHSAALEELKNASGSHATALEPHGATLDSTRAIGASSEPVANTVDLAPLEAQVAAIISILEAHSAAFDEIKTIGASHTSALGGHGAALENIKSLGGSEGPTEGGSLANLEAQVNAIVETLQTHTSALEELKGITSSHVTAFAERSIDDPPVTESGNLSALETQIGSLASTLESHGSILDEIKATGGLHGAILDEIKTAHTTNTSALDEIKIKTLENGSLLEEIRSPGLPPSEPTGGITDISNLAALEIQIGSVVNTLSTHTSALADIGARVGAPNAALLVPGSETTPQDDLNTVMEILDTHSAILNEIKEDVSAEILTALHNVDQKQENVSSLLVEIRESDVSEEVLTLLHGVGENASSHAAALESIRESMQASHGALEEIKSRDIGSSEATAPAQVDLSAIEAQIASMMTILEEHKTALSSIKDTTTASHDLHGSHTTVLEELMSRAIEQAPASEISIFKAVEGKIDSLIAGLDEHKSTLATIQETTAASHELYTSHTASLGEIKSRSLEPATASTVEVPDFSGLETQLGGIVASLEEHKAMLSSMQELHRAHAASLDEIKSRSIEISPPADEAPDFSGVEAQINSIVSSLEEHKAMLSFIQESYGTHTASLDEIKSKSIDPSHISSILAGLEEHKASLAAVQEQATALHDLHVAHSSSLDEIKSRSIDTASPEVQPTINVQGLETQVGSIISVLQEQKTTLSELKDMTSGLAETHTAHAGILNEIRDGTTQSNESHTSHAVILGELKSIPTPESPDLSAIEAHLTTILTTLESQTETLSSLKDSTNTAEIHDIAKQSQELLTTNHELLTSNTALLDAIKQGTSTTHEDIKSLILESKSGIDTHGELVKDLHSSTTESHSNLTNAIAALALGGAAGAGTTALLSHSDDDKSSSSEVLAEVKAVRAIAESSKEDIESIKNQIDINHTTVTTSLSALGDEIKSEIDASATGVGERLEAVHGDVKAVDINSLREKLDQHGSGLAGITTQLEGIDGGVRAIDLTPIHAALEKHGSGIGGLATQLEGIDSAVKTFDLAPLHEKLDQHASNITGISTQLEDVHGSVKAIDLSPVHEKLDQHGSDVQALGTHLETFDLAPVHAALELHGAGIDGIYSQLESIDGNVIGLLAGVHLSDAGLGQLQSNVIKRKISRPAMSEGAWFKRDRSVSPVLERSNPVDEGNEHSSIPAVLAGVMAGGAVIGGAVIGGAAALLPKNGGDEKPSDDTAPPRESIEKGEPIEAQGLDELTEAEVQNSPKEIAEENQNTVSELVKEVQHPEIKEAVVPTNEQPTDPIEEAVEPSTDIIEPEAESRDSKPLNDVQPKFEERDDDNTVESKALPEDAVDSPVEEPIEKSNEFVPDVVENAKLDPEAESRAVEDPNDAQPGFEAGIPEEVVEELAPEPIDAEPGTQIPDSGEVEEKVDPSLSAIDNVQVEPESESLNTEVVPEQEPEEVKEAKIVDGELLAKEVVESSETTAIEATTEINTQPEAVVPEATETEPEREQTPTAPSGVFNEPLEAPSLEAVEEVHTRPESESPHPETTEAASVSEAKEIGSIEPNVELPQAEDSEAKDANESEATPDAEPESIPERESIEESKKIDSEPADSSLEDEIHPEEVNHPATSAESEGLKEDGPNVIDDQSPQIKDPVGEVGKEDIPEDLSPGLDLKSEAIETQAREKEVDVTESDGLPGNVLESSKAVESTEKAKEPAPNANIEDVEISPVAQVAEDEPIPDDSIVKEKSEDIDPEVEKIPVPKEEKSVIDSPDPKYNLGIEVSHHHAADHESNGQHDHLEASALDHHDSVEAEGLPSSEPGQEVSDSSIVEDGSIVHDELAHSGTKDIGHSNVEHSDENINDLLIPEHEDNISKDKHDDSKEDNSSIDQDGTPFEHVEETLSTMPHERALPNESEHAHHNEDAEETLPIEHEQETDNFDLEDEEKPEGALSPILESPVTDSGLGVGVEDPFSDAQTSESHSSQPQVQPFSYPSTFSYSPMLESRQLEPQLRETAASQLGTMRELRSEEPLSSPSIKQQPQGIDFGFRQAQLAQEPFTPIHAQFPSLPTQPYPPQASSPLEQSIQSRSPGEHTHHFEPLPTDNNYESFPTHTQHLVSPDLQNFPLAIPGHNDPHSRRSTLEDHAAPSIAPRAEYYAPSATESHYSPSDHSNTRAEADPFAPMYDNNDAYSPDDLVNQYAGDYTPSAYGQTPASGLGSGRIEYLGNAHPGLGQYQYGGEDVETPPITSEHTQYFDNTTAPITSHYDDHDINSAPQRAFPPPLRPQYSGELSPLDRQYMQRNIYETERLASDAQYPKYTEERSPTEASPYSEQSLLDGEDGEEAPPLPTHRSQYTGDGVLSSRDERLQGRYTSPEPQYIAPYDERYMQEQAQGQRYTGTSPTPAHQSQYEDDDDEVPNTGQFKQQFGSRNPFAAANSRENIGASPLRTGYAQDFISPRSNDRFMYEEDEEEQWAPRDVTYRGLGEHEDMSREAGYGGFEDVENVRPSVPARRGGPIEPELEDEEPRHSAIQGRDDYNASRR